jgi:hypothetical protein
MNLLNQIKAALELIPTAEHLPDVFAKKPEAAPKGNFVPPAMRKVAAANGSAVFQRSARERREGNVVVTDWDLLNVSDRNPANAKGGLEKIDPQLTDLDIYWLEKKRIAIKTGAALKLILASHPGFTASELAKAGSVSETTAQNAKKAFANAQEGKK